MIDSLLVDGGPDGNDCLGLFGAVGVGGTVSRVGGFCGGQQFGSVAGCLWDTGTSGVATSDGGTGSCTTGMQTQSTFTDAGWDFSGEEICFRLYDASADEVEEGNRIVTGASGRSLGTPDEPFDVVFGRAALTVNLAAGWNQVSLNQHPTDPSCDTVFAGLGALPLKAIGGGGLHPWLGRAEHAEGHALRRGLLGEDVEGDHTDLWLRGSVWP